MFRKQWRKDRFATMPKTKAAAALLAVMLAITTAPARSAETVTADDTARFLAGLPPGPQSSLTAFTTDPLWRQHARHFDSMFGREEIKLSKIRAFSRERLTDKHATMLYMFSGPDFLYATSFFPGASTYVLSGLEPIGDVPQLTSLSHPAVDQSLQSLESSLDSILSFSFFITRKMKTQLYGGPVYGTLPILYVFLARTGKTVHEVSFVGLDEQGNLLPPSETGPRGIRSAVSKGVKIVFSAGDGPRQTLYYFSTNVADDSVDRTGLLAFCAKLGPADSFIKSASYLLHTGRFNKVRNFLLGHSATILQDDSGIPLAYFDPKAWRFQAFGRYVGPLGIFGTPYQTRMGELFRENAIPIDFGVGYRWRTNESNLVLAQKIAFTTGNSALAPRLPTDRYHRAAVGTPQSPRKHVEHEAAQTPLACRTAGIFPFCSTWQIRPSQ
jgi:hypothetical protein